MTFDTVYALAVALVGSPVVTTLLVKKFGAKAAVIEKEAVQVATEAKPILEAGIHTVETLLKLPELAPLKLKVAEDEATLRKSRIATVVRGLLNAYPQVLSELTDDQKANIVLFAQKELATQFGVKVTSAEITDALQECQRFSDAFANSDLFKQIEATVAMKKQLAADAQQALAPATTV